MLTKSSNYILHLHGQLVSSQDVIGTLASEYVYLRKNEIPLPDAFVITGFAFDDFLTASGIIDDVGGYLIRLDGSPNNAKEISEEITKLLLRSNYPSSVLNPILQAYKNLSGFTDKHITLRPSWLIDSQLEPENFVKQHTKPGIKGDTALLYAIKQIWASLFSPESLLLRYRSGYDGELSISIMVQKEVQSEIFGEVFYPTDHPNYDTPALAEVTALMGMPHDYQQYGEKEVLEPDIYLIDANQNLLLEKHVTTQPYMYLRKSRSAAATSQNELFRVEISPEWQKRQKLDDGLIQDLGFIVKHAAELLDSVVELEWAYEGNKLYVLHLRRINELRLATNDIHDLQSEVETEMQKHSDGVVDHDPHDKQWEIVPTKPGTLDFDELTKEIEELSHELAFELDFIEPEALEQNPQLTAERINYNKSLNLEAYDINLKLYLDVSDLNASELHHAQEFAGAYYDATKMLLNYKLLPEAVYEDKSQLKDLVDNYAADIATVAKVLEPKPILYSFSNLREDHYTKMSAQKLFDADVSGSERFIKKPEALISEVLAVKKARAEMSKRNIQLIIPYLRSEPELVSIKKILNKEGIRQTHSLQLWAEVSTPALLHEIEHLKPNDVSGLVIDLAQLVLHMTGRKDIVERDMDIVLTALQRAVGQRSFRLIFKLDPQIGFIKKLSQYKFFPEGLILLNYPTQDYLRELADLFASPSGSTLKVRQSAGRPQKSLWK